MLLVIVGLLILHMPQANAQSIYSTIKQITEEESQTEVSELSVMLWALGIYHDHIVTTNITDGTAEDFEVEKEHVDLSLQKNLKQMCGGDGHELIVCDQAQKVLTEAVKRGSWHRRLGRDLSIIASGYETGIHGYPGRPIDVITRMSGISHMWLATNDPFVHPILEQKTRGAAWPPANKADIVNDLSAIINDMQSILIDTDGGKKDDTEFVAAVTRMRNGVNYLEEKEGPCAGAPSYPANLERIWQERRWCDFEERLRTVLNTLVLNPPLDPPREKGEHVIFPSFTVPSANIAVWIREDDIGLQWYIPIKPVQAALFHPDYGDCLDSGSPKDCFGAYDTSILRGGNYPESLDADGTRVPEPDEGEGLCSHPFAQRGYLCRRLDYEACDLSDADQQEVEDNSIDGDILLTRCQPERFRGDVARRVSGEDICGIGGWRAHIPGNDPKVQDTPDRDEDMFPSECSACAVDIVCSADCNGETDAAFADPISRDNGVIEVCIPADFEGSGAVEYIVMHELVHAQQLCNQSKIDSLDRIGTFGDKDGDGTISTEEREEQAAACCAIEREAYFAQCKTMALDGVLDAAGVTIDQCASAFANFSCSNYGDLHPDGNACTNDGIDPQLIMNAIAKGFSKVGGDLGLPLTCAEVVNNPSPRVQNILNSLPLVCKPGCESQYINTIGNNMCYIGQCIEQAHEFHRPHPGRQPLTAVDQDFPWDACEKENPDTGGFEVPPAIMSQRIPSYKPRQIMQLLDVALCQINGLPAKTPPVLCGFDPRRRLNTPPVDAGLSVWSLNLQPEEYATTGLGMQFAAPGIGARIVSDMFTQYLTVGARQFADIFGMAHHTLDALSEIDFAQGMCPRIAGFGLCQQLK